MNDKDVAIVTVSDAKYLPAACCQLASTAEYLTPHDNAQLFLIACDVTVQDLANASRFFKSHRLEIELMVPDFVDEIAVLTTARWPRAAYLRLYFDRIFDSHWRRLVYLDADTRVCSPLSPLLNADLKGRPIGAVHDFIYYVTGNIERRRKDLFLAPDAPYFQSGVMVFDWPQMLATDGLARTRRFLAEHPEACYEAPDQDALNGTFENRWTPLDPRWNLHETYLMFGKRLQPKLRHFTSNKPWASTRPRAWRQPAEWYRAQLAGSAWEDFVEPQSFTQALKADVRLFMRAYYPRLRGALPASIQKMLPHNRYLPWVPKRNRDVEDMAAALLREALGQCEAIRPPESVLPKGNWLTAT